jgi:hypothetical protein
MEKGGDLVSMTKRIFWPIFKHTWDMSLTEVNILSVFAKTGIWPYNPHIVLSVVVPPRLETPLEISPNTIVTPYMAKCIWQFSRVYTKNLTKEAIRKLIKANEINAAWASIAEHCSEDLKEVLQIEKKRNIEKRNSI